MSDRAIDDELGQDFVEAITSDRAHGRHAVDAPSRESDVHSLLRRLCPSRDGGRRQAGETFSAVITAVVEEAQDCRSFLFAPVLAPATQFQPNAGQFIRLHARIADMVHVRCYAVSSLVARGEVPRFTVKRVPHGLVSNWCHDVLSPGMLVTMSPPAGRFKLRPGTNQLVFMAGGIGIAPLLPMIQETLQHGTPPITVMQFNQEPSQAPFLGTLRKWAQESAGRLRLIETFAGEGDFATTRDIKRHFRGLIPADVYMCGPDGFMRRAEAAALASGVSSRRIFVNVR